MHAERRSGLARALLATAALAPLTLAASPPAVTPQDSLAARLEQARARTDPVERARAEAAVFHAARDFPRVLAAARRGLEEREDPLLLWRAAAAALWLQDGEAAVAWSERLLASLEGAAMGEEERAGWQRSAEDFRAQGEELVARAEEAEQALVRARLAVAAGAAGAVGLVVLALRRRRSR